MPSGLGSVAMEGLAFGELLIARILPHQNLIQIILRIFPRCLHSFKMILTVIVFSQYSGLNYSPRILHCTVVILHLSIYLYGRLKDLSVLISLFLVNYRLSTATFHFFIQNFHDLLFTPLRILIDDFNVIIFTFVQLHLDEVG